MVKAFVFGKFLPFHKGHEAMIRFALTKCDFLTVLICCSDKENTDAVTRKSWITNTFENERAMNVQVYSYREEELPNTSVSSRSVSEIWANIFSTLFPDYTLVITSEEYGNFLAGYMNIEHIPFDLPKAYVPVSATDIRRDIFANWKFLPDSVKPAFIIKVVVLGTESTGKTTLTERLAAHYNCSSVSEAARDLIADSNDFSYDTLHLVAAAHATAIIKATSGDSPLIIIDTDIHTTISYSRFTFNQELRISPHIYNTGKADLYLYLNNDVPYFQDGTRLFEQHRNLLDFSHRQVLKDHRISYMEITGNWDARFAKSVELIDKLIEEKRQSLSR